MAWDKDIPADNSAIRLAPASIRDNWDAIVTADSTFTPDGFNFSEQAGNLADIASLFRLFSKSSGGNTELFGINSNGDINQFTFGSPTLAKAGSILLGGNGTTGLLLQWDAPASGINSGATITFGTAFSATPYYVGFNLLGSDTTVAVCGVNNQSATNFQAIFAGGGTRNFWYFAIGPITIT